jgi:RNA polymerase sigma-70 factor (ECF subfamily)
VEESLEASSPAQLDFRTLFEMEASYVVRSLRRLGVAPADVEDMAHDVFVAVYGQLDKFDRARPVRPWLFAFAFRVAAQYRRKARRETERCAVDDLPDHREPPDVRLEREGKQRMVLDALEGIELERRAVFVLHELDGATCQQIAATLGIPLGTVYSRLRLAREDFSGAVRRLQAQRGRV